jgi:hypothetical protein
MPAAPMGDRIQREAADAARALGGERVNDLRAAQAMTTMRSMGLSHTERVDSAARRRADSDDVQAVADLLVRSRRATVGAIPAAVHSDAEAREWISTVVIPEREVWLMEDADSQPLAVCCLAGAVSTVW